MTLYQELHSLQLPKRPPGAFNIFLQDQINDQKKQGKAKSYQRAESEALAQWNNGPNKEEFQAKYEGIAAKRFQEYQEEFKELSERGEAIREQIEEIQNRADINAIVRKKISPYRMYKKEIAS